MLSEPFLQSKLCVGVKMGANIKPLKIPTLNAQQYRLKSQGITTTYKSKWEGEGAVVA